MQLILQLGLCLLSLGLENDGNTSCGAGSRLLVGLLVVVVSMVV